MSESTESTSAVNMDPEKKRTAGVLIPVSSIRTDDDLGIGDVSGLAQFIDWAAELGFEFVQLLPITETGPDNSPYNAISSVAIEPLTLDCSPSGLSDLPEPTYWEVLAGHDLSLLREGDVCYPKVRELKMDLLWRAFVQFYTNDYKRRTDRDNEFHQFCADEAGWLGDYTLFRLLMDMEGGKQVWTEWSNEYNDADKARAFVDQLLVIEPAKTEQQLVFYTYVQWVAKQQWLGISEHAQSKGVRLMGDIPFGISVYSADVFANGYLFDLDWYGGAPPEKLFKDDPFVQKWGQNWGIPLYKWDVLQRRHWGWWMSRVRKTTDIFSMFRVDHALGFYRIYAFPWNPIRNDEFFPLSEEEAAERCGGRKPGFQPRPDDTPERKEANRADGEKYLSILQEAAGEATIIAEDLGTVPDYVRPSLASINIAGMKVPQWEHENGRIVQGEEYPHVSFATYATHDHMPLKMQWEIERLKLAANDEGTPEFSSAAAFIYGLCDFAKIDPKSGPDGGPPVYNDAVREALFRALFASQSREAGIMITDLLGLEDRINVPGVLADKNWVYRLDCSVEELSSNPHWNYLGTRIRKLLVDTGRATSEASG